MPRPPLPQPRPPFKTVLSEGESFATKYVRRPPPPLEAIDAEAAASRMQAFAAGKIPLDQQTEEDLRVLIDHTTPENKEERLGVARHVYGVGAFGRMVEREIVAAALSSAHPSRPKLHKDVDALLAPRNVIADRAEQGRAFRDVTGFGIAHLRHGLVNLLDDDNQVAVTLSADIAGNLAGDPRFSPALKLIAAAHRGERPADARASAAAAVRAAKGGEREQAVGDSLIFKSDEERVDLAEQGLALLAEPDLAPEARQIAVLGLITALAPEATPAKRSLRLLMDMAPGFGNVRAFEAMLESGEAAFAAFERGDYAEGGAETVATFFNALGAVAGIGTPVAAAASRSVRQTLKRSLRRGVERGAERRAARSVGKADAARRRTETMTNRPVGRQLEPEEWKAYRDVVKDLPPKVQRSVITRLHQAIGDAGELFFEPILQRWKPKSLSSAQLMRRRAREIARGELKPSKAARKHAATLRKSRNGHTVEADALVDDVVIIREGNSIYIIDSKNGPKLKPTEIEIKTGKTRTKQNSAYIENSKPTLAVESPNQTLNDYIYVHINQDEWKSHLQKSLKFRLKSLTRDLDLTDYEVRALNRKILKIFEVADFEEWTRIFLTELAAGSIVRQVK